MRLYVRLTWMATARSTTKVDLYNQWRIKALAKERAEYPLRFFPSFLPLLCFLPFPFSFFLLPSYLPPSL